MTSGSLTIAIIGAGNMGEALIKGLYRQHELRICEADTKRVMYLKKNYRLSSLPLAACLDEAHVVVLAVKPQDMSSILSQIKAILTRSGQHPLFISIAAGLTTAYFERMIQGATRVVRAMPNMPALIGEGITGITAGKLATRDDMKTAQAILATMGQTIVLKEKMLDALTAVSGSGPAYVFLWVEHWMAAAKALGFTTKEAKLLVYATLSGSAHLLMKSPLEAGVLREKVTSKGGTTAAALDVFAKATLDKYFKNALSAAHRRAKELSQ